METSIITAFLILTSFNRKQEELFADFNTNIPDFFSLYVATFKQSLMHGTRQ